MRDFATCLADSVRLLGRGGPGPRRRRRRGERRRAPEARRGVHAAATTPAAGRRPIKGGSLFFSVLWERIKRLFGGGRG